MAKPVIVNLGGYFLDQPPSLLDGIGPHEGRELALMLAGTKPLAMFVDVVPSRFVFPDDDFEPYVAAGCLIKRDFLSQTSDGRHQVRHLFFALPGEEWRITEAYAVSVNEAEPGSEKALADIRRLGQLLGYSDHNIQRFLSWLAAKS